MRDRRLRYALRACDEALLIGAELGLDVTAVAVDTGGHVIAALRGDHAGFTGVEVARRKAVTAAMVKLPTAAIAAFVAHDPAAAEALRAGDMLAVPGGFPLFLDGACIGGLGVAGGHHSEDQMVGERAVGRLGGEAPA